MATITFTQTDLTISSSISSAHCSGLASNGNAVSIVGVRDGGTPGTGSETPSVNNIEVRKVIFHETEAVGETVWAAGDYTIRIRITSGNVFFTLDEVHICRMNSSFVSQEDLGGATGIGRVMNNVGTETFTVSGAAATSPASSDLLLIIMAAFRNGDHGGEPIIYVSDLDMDTPIVRTGAAPTPRQFLRRYTHMPAPNVQLRL